MNIDIDVVPTENHGCFPIDMLDCGKLSGNCINGSVFIQSWLFCRVSWGFPKRTTVELGLQKLLGLWAMRRDSTKTCSRILYICILFIYIYRDCRVYTIYVICTLLTHVINTISLSVCICTQTISPFGEKSIYLSYLSNCLSHLSFLSHLSCLILSSLISSSQIYCNLI